MRKIFLWVLAVACALGIAGSLAKDAIVRSLIVKSVKSVGGFDVTIDQLHFGLLRPTLEIAGLKILNPTNYPVREALEISRLFVRYDRASLFGRHGHIPEIDIELARVVMIRRKDGEVNLERLAEVEAAMTTARTAPAAQPGPPAAPATSTAPTPPAIAKRDAPKRELQWPPVKIDLLRIKLDELDYYDYAMGAEPVVLPAKMNFDQTFLNVTNVMDIAAQLQTQLMLGDIMGGVRDLAKPPRPGREQPDRAVDQQIENVINKL